MQNLLTSVGVRVLLCSLVLGSSACSGSDGDGDGGSEGSGSTGTVTDEWSGYCVATFTEDHEVRDFFDDPLFTAHAGDQFLMSRYTEAFDNDVATLNYLTSKGPYDFEFEAPLGSRDFPFTANCEFDRVVEYLAVFDDVSVYETEALANKLCDLSAGTVVLRDATVSSGYGVASSDFNLTGPQTYEVFLNTLSQECGNAEKGYVSVPQTTVLGTHTWIVPIQVIIGPT